MSTDTSSSEEQGILLVGEKRILAQVVELRHPSIQHGLAFSQPITAASLWGVLRSYPVDSMLVTVTDPVRVVVNFTDWDGDEGYFDDGFYVISYVEYQKFLSYYCQSPQVDIDEALQRSFDAIQESLDFLRPRFPDWDWGMEYETLAGRDKFDWRQEGF